VLFSPSGKAATVQTVEVFSAPPQEGARAGESTGITLDQQVFVTRGEVMSRVEQPPLVSTKLRVNLFWLGHQPMVPGGRYKLKLGTSATEVTIDQIHRVLDASNLEANEVKPAVERHDVADLVLRTRQPVAFDRAADLEITGRFVIVDGYDIAGGGIVRDAVADDLGQRRLESQLRDRDWVRGDITPDRRAELSGHPASVVMITGAAGTGKYAVARELERLLVEAEHQAYLLNGKNVVLGVDADIELDDIGELVRRFGEVVHLLLDAGLLVITTTNVIGVRDHRAITTQVAPFPTFVVHLGEEAEGLPEATDLRFDPRPAPHEVAPIILRALAAQHRLRRGFDPGGRRA
jgi:bifunctional enzyme CysN/CysC